MEDRKPKAHQAKPSKSVHHVIYKATIFTVFLVILQLVPSILPDSIHSKIDSGSWELLQLIFVGIAVSYGLFSKKNDQNIDHKEQNLSLLDNANSYVSRLVHVSSVFDYENENPSLFDDNKIQAQSSQYYREKPVVMVAKESCDLEEQIPTSSRSNPLVSNRFVGNSRKLDNGDVMKMSPQKVEERTVLPSPIPWRLKIDDANSFPRSNPLFSSSMEPRSKGESFDHITPLPSQSFLHTPHLHKSKSGLSRKSDFLEMDLKKRISDTDTPLQRKSVRKIKPKFKDLEDNVIKDQLTATQKTKLLQEKRGLMDELMQQRLPDFRRESLMDGFIEDLNVENNDGSEKEKQADENANTNEGPDVDKKADEFIAKFREQIRLQRIESIRRSTNQHSRNHPR